MSIRAAGAADRPPGGCREQLISAVLPDVDRHPAPPPAPTALPVLPPAPGPIRTNHGGSQLIGAARVDRSGRIHEHRLLDALGWQPGQALAVAARDGVIIVSPKVGTGHRINQRGAIALPAAARQLCNVAIADTVILLADLPAQTLIVHPAAAVARLLATHMNTAIGGRDAR